MSETLAPQYSLLNQSFFTDTRTLQTSWPGPENVENQMAEWVHQFVYNKVEPATPPSLLQLFPSEEPKNISTIQSTCPDAATFPTQEDEADRSKSLSTILLVHSKLPRHRDPKCQPQVKEETPLPISPPESVSEAISNAKTDTAIGTRISNPVNQHDLVTCQPVGIDESGLHNTIAGGIEAKNGCLPSDEMQCENTVFENKNVEVPPVLDAIPEAGAPPEIQGPPLGDDEMVKLLQATLKAATGETLTTAQAKKVNKDVYGDGFERQKDYRNRLQTQCRWGSRWWRFASCAGLGVVLFAIGELAKKIGKKTLFQIAMVNALAIHLLNTYPGLVSFFRFTQPITLQIMLGRDFPIISGADTQALLDEASKLDLRTQKFPRTWLEINPEIASSAIGSNAIVFAKKYFPEYKATGGPDTMQLD
ncbi:hypothetical protein BBP40_002793 [Aspergillus hancockii]|nr:hypothetical protein BBP40_002793 [Aspergillus hancockii]